MRTQARTHSRREILRALRQIATHYGEPLRYMRGKTVRAMYVYAERNHCIVYWGLWTDADLDSVV